MTVSSTTNRVNYTGNGVTTEFSFPYIFYADADLDVYIDSVLQSSGYTVTGAGTTTGTITFSVAPAVDEAILIRRSVSFLQNTDFENFDGNPADVTEKQFDLVVMQTQQLADDVARSLKLREDDPTTSIELPLVADRANMFLAFDSAGNPTASAGATSTGTTFGATGEDLAATATPALARTVLELGAMALTASVATANIDADAVTLAKIDGDAAFADKLIGYDNSGDPANISAGAGILIDGSVIAAAAGAVLQVVQVVKTDSFTSSSTSYTDITGLSASITPSSASSKILVFVNVQGDATTNNFFMKIVRASTDIFLGDAASSRTRASGQISALGSSGSFIATASMCFLDSPATASAVTYKVQGMVPSSGSFFVNRSQTDTDGATFARVASSITLVEIKV